MMAEIKKAKRYIGAKFGYGEYVDDGVYAVPVDFVQEKAFMRVEMNKGTFGVLDNFSCFWDEDLTLRCGRDEKPEFKESKFNALFRKMEALR